MNNEERIAKLVQNDWSTAPVPKEYRRSDYGVVATLVGQIIALSGIYVGASMSGQLTIMEALLATVIGSAVLALIGGLLSWIGTKTGVGLSNNIVSNAILYSPRGSSIYMDSFSKNGAVVFQIENTGVHIPEVEIPKLFDAFYRMEQSRTRKTGGSGLGLYIVKTILEQHNIIYSLKNTDRGVLFSIRF